MELSIRTNKEDEFINITQLIKQKVREKGVKDGIVTVFVPHTTAGITINENADPDVVHDMLYTFKKVFPDRSEYRHYEGNSCAHIKASVLGSSCNVIIENGELK
ncbi:MAG: YjbQ family protein, partial [Clostridiaceae bacterium]|nr:YjbQ family protein [Clostridiaceae bacterium]